jgi:anaphase-promoting complex subunit 3
MHLFSTDQFSVTPSDTSTHPENFLQPSVRPNRFAQAAMPPPPPPPAVPPFMPTQPHPPVARPLSSAEETGPVQKRLRSTSRKPAGDPAKAPVAALGEDAPKKARARPALHLANFFSSSGRQPKSTTTTTRTAVNGGMGKGDREPPPRRSTRLLGGTNTRTTLKVLALSPLLRDVYLSRYLRTDDDTSFQSPPRDRRRPAAHGRTKSTESEMDDDAVGPSPSPPPNAPSPPSETSPPPPAAPVWTPADEAAAIADYCAALAEHAVYELTRHFAKATRAMALYDTQTCLDALDKLPAVHQRTPWVMAMVGKAHYERTEYAAVRIC